MVPRWSLARKHLPRTVFASRLPGPLPSAWRLTRLLWDENLRASVMPATTTDRRKSTVDVITWQNRLDCERRGHLDPAYPTTNVAIALFRLLCPSRQRNRIPRRMATASAVDAGKLSTFDRKSFDWTRRPHVKCN